MQEMDGKKVPNYEKQARYQATYDRLSLALDGGFYIEATAICESIICDRLHSHIAWRIKEHKQYSMNTLLKRLKMLECYQDSPPRLSLSKCASLKILIDSVALDFDDYARPNYVRLPERLDEWRDKRNGVAHRIAYTVPSLKTYGEEFGAFMSEARGCALTGKELAQHVSGWDSMARRRLTKARLGS